MRLQNRSGNMSTPTRSAWATCTSIPTGRPHFHAVGVGYLVNAKDYNQATGWIYKNKRPGGIPLSVRWNEKENRFEDDVYTLFSYLMTHAAYVQGKRAVRTFGYLNPQHVQKVGGPVREALSRGGLPGLRFAGDPLLVQGREARQPEIGIEGEQRPVACRICGYNYKVRR